MTAVVKPGLRRWTKIFHFTNRRADAHNHAKSIDREACQRAVNLRGVRFPGFSALQFSR